MLVLPLHGIFPLFFNVFSEEKKKEDTLAPSAVTIGVADRGTIYNLLLEWTNLTHLYRCKKCIILVRGILRGL